VTTSNISYCRYRWLSSISLSTRCMPRSLERLYLYL